MSLVTATAPCPACHDTGWVMQDDQARRCKCIAERTRAERLREACIPPRFAMSSFLSYKRTVQNEAALEASEAFVKAIRRGQPSRSTCLLLSGPSETGKTRLAVAALRFLIDEGRRGLFQDYGVLIREQRLSKVPVAAHSTPFLVLDDLGAVAYTDWTADIVRTLLTHRYNNALPMVVTTSLPYETRKNHLLNRIGPEAFERLFAMSHVVEINGERRAAG